MSVKSGDLPSRGAMALLWLLVLLVPCIFSVSTHESFRLPKQLVAEPLALASLVFLSLRLYRPRKVDVGALLRHPAVLVCGPLLLVASLGFFFTDHPLHVRRGLQSLWIGAACLVGWSLGLNGTAKRRLLRGQILPALFLVLVLVLQFYGLYNPLQFETPTAPRLGLTSLAGGAFDLGAYLVLVALVAQVVAWETFGRRRWFWGLGAAVCFYGILLTQTLTALAAVVAASAVLWWTLLPRRRFAAFVGVAILLVGTGVAAVEPLQMRFLWLVRNLASLDNVDRLLVGRLDGWRAALHMWSEHPIWGVGQGAFTTEFAAAKRALLDEGVVFFSGHSGGRAHFASAHNEYLEVIAECGTLGLCALLWGLFVLGRQCLRTRPPDAQALVRSGCTALLLLACTTFSMHVALVAFPYVLFLSWVLEEGKA